MHRVWQVATLTAEQAPGTVSVTPVFIVLVALAVGIFVGVAAKKLTWTEILVVGVFALLLGGATPVGPAVASAINSIGH